jgi:ornithine cyclodeaminase/alanine dehydrogenase-like protein (mu-crystallin family)
MTKLINKTLIESNYNFTELIEQIRKYYVLLNEGQLSLTARLFSTTESDGMHIIGGATNYKTKSFIAMAQPVFPWMREKALPVATTSYIYSDYMTGELKAIVGGADTVLYRTPAKSALAAKYLAPKRDSYTLGLLGLGVQATTHAEAFCETFNIKKIVGMSRTPNKWKHNIDSIEEKTGKKLELLSREEVIKQADILVVITSAEEPLVHYKDLHKGQLVIGTDHAETVAKDVVLNADAVFVDYAPTAKGEPATIKILLDEGHKYDDLVDGDLLQLSTEDVVARKSEDDIIFFQSLGVLCENLAAVEYFYDKVGSDAEEFDFN